MEEIKLGHQVKDKITGYKGMVVSITTFMHGCVRMGVQGVVQKDGKLPEVDLFDAPDLEITGPGLSGDLVPEPKVRRKQPYGNPSFRPTRTRLD